MRTARTARQSRRARLSRLSPRTRDTWCHLPHQLWPGRTDIPAAVAHERIAFEIEENVARRRSRQAREPLSGLYRQLFVIMLVASPSDELNASLLTDFLIGLDCASGRFEAQGQSEFPESGKSICALLL